MDKSRPAADRVRPILFAMERSIDAARKRRLNQDEPDEREPVVPISPENKVIPPVAGATPRLKARPKRPTPMVGFDDGQTRAAG